MLYTSKGLGQLLGGGGLSQVLLPQMVRLIEGLFFLYLFGNNLAPCETFSLCYLETGLSHSSELLALSLSR